MRRIGDLFGARSRSTRASCVSSYAHVPCVGLVHAAPLFRRIERQDAKAPRSAGREISFKDDLFLVRSLCPCVSVFPTLEHARRGVVHGAVHRAAHGMCPISEAQRHRDNPRTKILSKDLSSDQLGGLASWRSRIWSTSGTRGTQFRARVSNTCEPKPIPLCWTTVVDAATTGADATACSAACGALRCSVRARRPS